MVYENMNNILLRKFPEIGSRMTEISDMFGDEEIPKYVLYEQVFNKFIHEALLENNDKEKIDKIFVFLEEMAVSKDLEVNNLLSVGILEYILSEEDIRDTAISFMGRATRNRMDNIKM